MKKGKWKKTKNTTTYRSMATLTDVGPQTGTIWNAGDEKLHVPGEGKLLNHVFSIDLVLEKYGGLRTLIEDLQVQNRAVAYKQLLRRWLINSRPSEGIVGTPLP
jgi:hypothetical protein